jgi:hypothetical protein
MRAGLDMMRTQGFGLPQADRGAIQKGKDEAPMTQAADKQTRSPNVPEREKQSYQRGPRPEPAKPKTSDPERDRYGSRGQQTDPAGRERRELAKDDDEYGDFLRDDEPRDDEPRTESTGRAK